MAAPYLTHGEKLTTVILPVHRKRDIRSPGLQAPASGVLPVNTAVLPQDDTAGFGCILCGKAGEETPGKLRISFGRKAMEGQKAKIRAAALTTPGPPACTAALPFPGIGQKAPSASAAPTEADDEIRQYLYAVADSLKEVYGLLKRTEGE